MVPRYDMMMPWCDINGRYPATAQCYRGVERKQRLLAEEEIRESSERAFQDYFETLDNLTAFKYLVRELMEVGGDWPSVAGNLRKARNLWVRMSRILSREGEDPKVSGHFFKAVVQAVLLFWAETWVLTPRM